MKFGKSPVKLALTLVVAFIAMWIVFKTLEQQRRQRMMAAQPAMITTSDVGFIPGSGFQDAGYGSGVGSIGARPEGFEAGFQEGTAGCPEHDLIRKYPSMPFVQVGCKPEPEWNLPYDARMQHRPMYPIPEGNQICQRRHPMDSVYQPPNEGFDLGYATGQ